MSGIHGENFPHHAVRRDDTHIAPNAVSRAAINIYDLASGVWARANHVRGDHGSIGMRGAKIQQRGEPVRFEGPAFQLGVTYFQAVELGAHGIVFFLRGAKADVPAPAVLGAVDGP